MENRKNLKTFSEFEKWEREKMFSKIFLIKKEIENGQKKSQTFSKIFFWIRKMEKRENAF